MSDKIYDFAVIGAGMAGASIAAELGCYAAVLLLEGEDNPGYHSTGRSAAFWEASYGGPGVAPLTLASGQFLQSNGFLHERGALYLGRDEDKPAMDAFIAQYQGTGVELVRRDRAELTARVPYVRDEWTDCIWQQACADIDVAGLHQLYLKTCREQHVELSCRSRAVRIERASGVWRILTEAGSVHYAARIVNAAGAWADQIAHMAGALPLGIQPKRRTVAQLRVAPAAPSDLPLVLDINGGFYFKPDNGRLWLSPHDEISSSPCDAAPEEIDVARAVDRFQSVTDWQIEAVERRWAGLRSFAPDRLPVYGADRDIDDFFWFAGQGGFGIQTAPAAARLGSQIMLNLSHDEMTSGLDADAYLASRFKVVNEAGFQVASL